MQHGAAAELLARVPLFYGIAGEPLTTILNQGEMRRFGAGELIVMTGEAAVGALFVLEGTVSLFDDHGCMLDLTLEPGMSLDEMAMFVETSHLFSAVANDEVFVLYLTRAAVEPLMRAEPALAARFAGNIRERLERTAETLRGLDEMLAQPVPDPSFPDLPGIHDAVLAAHGMTQRDGAPEGGDAGAAGGREAPRDAGGLLSELNRAIGGADRIPPEPEHDPTAYPSPAPRRQRAA